MDPYISASDKTSFACRCAQILANEENRELHGASAHGKKVARTFWGYSWCRNIESWQDYESRLPAGRSLLRAGAVIDLILEKNLIKAFVADAAEEALRTVRIPIRPPEEELLTELRMRCAGSIRALMDLIQGNLSDELLQAFCDPVRGIFPKSNELKFICDCTDDSCLCRHAAAALYGAGTRLDDDPALFFLLRGITPEMFFDAGAAAEELSAGADFNAAELSETFGIGIGEP